MTISMDEQYKYATFLMEMGAYVKKYSDSLQDLSKKCSDCCVKTKAKFFDSQGKELRHIDVNSIKKVGTNIDEIKKQIDALQNEKEIPDFPIEQIIQTNKVVAAPVDACFPSDDNISQARRDLMTEFVKKMRQFDEFKSIKQTQVDAILQLLTLDLKQAVREVFTVDNINKIIPEKVKLEDIILLEDEFNAMFHRFLQSRWILSFEQKVIPLFQPVWEKFRSLQNLRYSESKQYAQVLLQVQRKGSNLSAALFKSDNGNWSIEQFFVTLIFAEMAGKTELEVYYTE